MTDNQTSPTNSSQASQSQARPRSVLFACTHNMIRSPMAEGIFKKRFKDDIFVDSCGIHAGVADNFTTLVMEEIEIDLSNHSPKNFDDLSDESFDLIICFSEDSYAVAQEFAHNKAIKVEHWPIYDVALTSEKHQVRLEAYRMVRNEIIRHLDERFS